MDTPALSMTDFRFPGQTALYHGKVRDVYTIGADTLISVATDRVSAFDQVLSRPIPYKGQVLNQLAAHFLEATQDIVPNWLQAVPDPNVSIGVRAEPVKVEVVVRSALVGHAWREYKAGKRELCGNPLPDGLKEYDAFQAPLITPTTKADEGHDEDISEADILAQGLVSGDDWLKIKEYALGLFAAGQRMARERGLVLADTKYEFGRTPDGSVILIDEVHTPDSSRYFHADGYDAYTGGKSDEPPRHLSKEFLRQWLLDKGWDGTGEPPEIDDAFAAEVSDRYMELYRKLTGQEFEKADTGDIPGRIERNVLNYIQGKH
jgi:phosphoribosylaminoimidazole-succinocarboxamide synthase